LNLVINTIKKKTIQAFNEKTAKYNKMGLDTWKPDVYASQPITFCIRVYALCWYEDSKFSSEDKIK
jgi:hypothetical protein